jgi:hypothetical protein
MDNIPAIKVQTSDWLIAAVTFQRDETGEHALVTMMAPGSFDPEPIGNLGIVLAADIDSNNPTKTTPDTTTGAAGVQGAAGSPSGPVAPPTKRLP